MTLALPSILAGDADDAPPEIATITSPGPGRAVGVPQQGPLGGGADADVPIDNDYAEPDRMFGYPRYVIKGGEVVLEEGEIRLTPQGREFIVQPAYDEKIEEYLRPACRQVYTMSFDNYPVEMERIARPEIRACE